jgi:prophage antirepressor-like protein
LKRQVKASEAEGYYKRNNNEWTKAFRAWVQDTVNKKIRVTNFMCDTTNAPLARDVLVIADALKSAKNMKV